MGNDGGPPPTVASIGISFLLAGACAIGGLEHCSHDPRLQDPPVEERTDVPILTVYARARAHVFRYWFLYGPAALIAPALLYAAFKKLAAEAARIREKASGFTFADETYELPKRDFDLVRAIRQNPSPDHQVLLGMNEAGDPIYLSDRDRSTHLHVMGQTGSGKTKSVGEPLTFQDLLRGRSIVTVDAKGSLENHERFMAMLAASGRLSEAKVFSLIPNWPTHTYNLLHLTPNADPKAVAQRAFSSFCDDMDNSYYRNQAGNFFEALVRAFASTGKRFCMMDVAAAVASPEVLAELLTLASDRRAKREIETQRAQLGNKMGQTFTGLLAALRRYDIPALNAYDPDIILEDDLARGIPIAFFLPANLYKQLARYVGLVVFQHIQYIGALRQTTRSSSSQSIYVYADEFYNFAYEGFTDALNKLRDAGISILLSHQTFSDLQKVSPEFADGVWDNTRNKVILYQNHPDTCERIAKTLGTEKGVELTIRQSADEFLNRYSPLEASSRQVDSYRCHPNRIKQLKCGQAYLGQDATFCGVNLATLPPALVDRYKHLRPPAPKARPAVEGIRLHEHFLGSEVA